jgi:hypothetical protein
LNIAAENQMEARSWLVYVLTTMPNEFAMPPEGGMPERLEPISRIPTQSIEINGAPVAIRPVEEALLTGVEKDLRFSWARIAVRVEAADAQQAIDLAMESLEIVFESLSFQLQIALQLHSLEAIDVTAPVREGDEREIADFPRGVG